MEGQDEGDTPKWGEEKKKRKMRILVGGQGKRGVVRWDSLGGYSLLDGRVYPLPILFTGPKRGWS